MPTRCSRSFSRGRSGCNSGRARKREYIRAGAGSPWSARRWQHRRRGRAGRTGVLARPPVAATPGEPEPTGIGRYALTAGANPTLELPGAGRRGEPTWSGGEWSVFAVEDERARLRARCTGDCARCAGGRIRACAHQHARACGEIAGRALNQGSEAHAGARCGEALRVTLRVDRAMACPRPFLPRRGTDNALERDMTWPCPPANTTLEASAAVSLKHLRATARCVSPGCTGAAHAERRARRAIST